MWMCDLWFIQEFKSPKDLKLSKIWELFFTYIILNIERIEIDFIFQIMINLKNTV